MQCVDYGDKIVVCISMREVNQWLLGIWPTKHEPIKNSYLEDKRVYAAYSPRGLLRLRINGSEVEAIGAKMEEVHQLMLDALQHRLSPGHPCYDVTVGRFLLGERKSSGAIHRNSNVSPASWQSGIC